MSQAWRKWLKLDCLFPGNKYLNQLTATRKCKLQIDVVTWKGISQYELCDTFAIGTESSGFMLTFGGYNGTTGRYLCFMYVMLIYMNTAKLPHVKKINIFRKFTSNYEFNTSKCYVLRSFFLTKHDLDKINEVISEKRAMISTFYKH